MKTSRLSVSSCREARICRFVQSLRKSLQKPLRRSPQNSLITPVLFIAALVLATAFAQGLLFNPAAQASLQSQFETAIIEGSLTYLQHSPDGSSLVQIHGKIISSTLTHYDLELTTELQSRGVTANTFDIQSDCANGIFEISELVALPSKCKVGEPCAASLGFGRALRVLRCSAAPSGVEVDNHANTWPNSESDSQTNGRGSRPSTRAKPLPFVTHEIELQPQGV